MNEKNNRKNQIQVTCSSLPPLQEYIDEIRCLWDSHWLTNMGEKHELFKRQLKEYLKVDNVELFVNGHMSLEMTLQALGLEGEIITTPFTFASTTHAIVRNGIEPVFCDISPADFTIDTSKIEELITEKTSAILPVHVYGNICDVEAISRIAKQYKLKVVYDAAHAFGELYNGISVGALGDASCFSFHATKVFNSIEGGAVCYKDKSLGELLYSLKNFGIKGPEMISGVGANAKMNEFCAAMGVCNLRHISDEIEKRKLVDERYRENLNDIEGIQLNIIQENVKSNYAYFPILIDEKKFGNNRNVVFEKLQENEIFARKYFYPLTSASECYRRKYDETNTPNALDVSKKVLTLPLYSSLRIEQIDKICEIIISCGKGKKNRK